MSTASPTEAVQATRRYGVNYRPAVLQLLAVFIAILPFRRFVDNILYPVFPLLAAGWKEGVIFVLFLPAVLCLRDFTKGWRIFVMLFISLVALYVVTAQSFYAVILRVPYLASGPIIFVLLVALIKTDRDLSRVTNTFFWALTVFAVVSAVIVPFDDISVRTAMGMPTELSGYCDRGGCVRLKQIFGREWHQRGGLLFEPFACGYVTLTYLALLASRYVRLSRGILIALLAAAVIVIAAALVRSVFIGAVVMLFLLPAMALKFRRFFIASAAGLSAILSVLFVKFDLVVSSLTLSDWSAAYRILTYTIYLPRLLLNYPMGFGFVFDPMYQKQAGLEVTDLQAGESFISALAVSMGIPGIALYLMMIVAVTMRLSRGGRLASPRARQLAVWSASVFVAVHISCLVLPALFDRVTNVILWTMVAIAWIALDFDVRRRQRPASSQ